jgi:hypothetical protein
MLPRDRRIRRIDSRGGQAVRLHFNVNPVWAAYQLRAYGEDTVADRLRDLSEDDLRRLGDVSAGLAQADAKMPLAQVVALAAVEVIEGAPRPLRRRRRHFKGIPEPRPDWFIESWIDPPS